MKLHGLVVLIWAVLIAATAPAQSVRDGITAWQKGDHEAAIATWRPLAEAGDSDAAFNLGQAYRLGKGTPISLAAAQIWLERAARGGHVEAQSTLGLLLFGSGNRTGGLRWLKAAAKSTLADLDSALPLEQRQQGVALALAKAKAPKPAAAAPASASQPKTRTAAPPAAGAWRIQLGAFGRRSSAEALFTRLADSPALSGRSAFYVPAGAMTRLQAGPFASRAAAASACATLAKRGQACFPVAAR